jgi:hypothetical protein
MTGTLARVGTRASLGALALDTSAVCIAGM